MGKRKRTHEIRQFILDHIGEHPRDIARFTAEFFQISPNAVTSRHLREMVNSGTLRAEGNTRSRRYELNPIAELQKSYPLNENFQEDVPWQQDFGPLLANVPDTIYRICAYGVTEMLNNAKDHSESLLVHVSLRYTADAVEFRIADEGVGIFRKIKDQMGLMWEQEAILELAKGKLTTDPVNHTGEGIFFTSRIFDLFSIISHGLYFYHRQPDDDWLIELAEPNMPGTTIKMWIALDSPTEIKDIFDRFTAVPESYDFSKTHVPIRLAQFGNDNLVSRSQARRILVRLERFQEVILDFEGVDFIGQAFADEIFRVFQNEHPDIRILFVRTMPEVQGMIQRARNAGKK